MGTIGVSLKNIKELIPQIQGLLKEVESMENKKQVAFYLGLSENIIYLLKDSEYYEDARKALDLCWEWFENKQVSGDEIYTLLDHGTEFNGLFIQMQMDEDENNEAVWECIVTAVSLVNKEAYESEKRSEERRVGKECRNRVEWKYRKN